MDSAGYIALSRQTALFREMSLIANNIANVNTTGFRQEGILFSEFMRRADGDDAISMSTGRIGVTSFAQGSLQQTGSPYDLAIEGEGYFQIATPDGERLTRAGAFSPSAEGTIVTPDGHALLDVGGAPVFVPPDGQMAVASDGTVSVDGRPIAQIGIVRPLEPQAMERSGGVLFRADAGVEPVEAPRLSQGFVEASNVDPILQVARMVEVQRAYELGQSFLEREDDRIKKAIQSITK